jgi:Uncharacterised 5xTM membrane BCR, YitT family COG1284
MGLNTFFQELIINQVKKSMGGKNAAPISKYRLAKAGRVVRINIFSAFKDALLLLLGVLSAGFGLRGFLVPNDFIDGGVMGISLHWPCLLF